MYEARKICNFLLSNFDAVEFDLTNLRINKLLFFIQAGALRQMPDGLIRNHFEAWQFGPVIKPVFDAFKIHKESPITGPAQFLDYSSGQHIPVPYDDIREEHRKIIVREFKAYSHFTTGQLVSLSHESNGPWDVVYRACLADPTMSPRIPNQLIRAHFAGERKSTVRH